MTPLVALNFVVLQWFGVRLSEVRTLGIVLGDPRDHSRHVRWYLLRWVWPLTGWWSPYRWIVRR